MARSKEGGQQTAFQLSTTLGSAIAAANCQQRAHPSSDGPYLLIRQDGDKTIQPTGIILGNLMASTCSRAFGWVDFVRTVFQFNFFLCLIMLLPLPFPGVVRTQV